MRTFCNSEFNGISADRLCDRFRNRLSDAWSNRLSDAGAGPDPARSGVEDHLVGADSAYDESDFTGIPRPFILFPRDSSGENLGKFPV